MNDSFKRRIRKNKIYSKMGKVLSYSFLIILLVFTIFPLLYVVLGSFKTNQELVLGGVNLFPKDFTFNNYVEAWKLANFARYTLNSIVLSFSVMSATVIIASMTGYCFSRSNFRGKEILYGMYIAFMFVNIGSVTLRPLFDLAVKVNMHSSLSGVIFIAIGTGQATYIFLVRGYLNSIPKSLDEAAKIDGCTFFGTYWRIILPLLKPVLATVALLSFRSAWNEFILPLVFTMTRPDIRPLTVGVVALRNTGDGAAAWNLMFAGSTMSIIPIVIIYLVLSRYFISGLTIGAVKG